MEKIVLKTSKRDVIGKKVKYLRYEGKLPAIIYGNVKTPIPIAMNLLDTTKIMRGVGSSTVIFLDVDGEEIAVLLRDVQRDVIRGHYLHLDFLALNLKETVRTMVSLFVVGEAPAIEEFGAVLMTGLTEIEIEALPSNLVDSIELDVSILKKIGDSINVNDLLMPEGVECLVETNDMLVVATAPVLIVEEEEEGLEGEEELDGDAEPEVIEKGKEEEED